MRGNPDWILKRQRTLKKRIFINENNCWVWNGPTFPDGYGKCGEGFIEPRAHRASFLLFKGKIPEKMWVLHTCDLPLCINPDHLYLGDVKQNVKDAIERGLFPTGTNSKKSNKGEKNGRAKLSEIEVKEIKEKFGKPLGGYRLGKLYNISKRQVYRIVKGESWIKN